jgi:hypothetical protein
VSAHSKIGASSMHRWSKCPGSVKLSEGIESVSSKYAEEGTLAHGRAAHFLISGYHVVPPAATPNPEMDAAVDFYITTLFEDSAPYTKDILVEVKFDLSQIHPGLYGTADAVFYNPETKVLYVYDFKYGQGILVEAKNNPQLMYYGLGALLSTGYPCSEVELVIVQPRAEHPDGPIRRWRTSAFNMVEFAADLKNFALATEDPTAHLVAGDHCKFCPAAGICPELSSKALSIAQQEFSPSFSYDPHKLSETLKKVDLLEDYAKSVRAFAYAEAEHGRCPPGWKLVNKRATRKWNRPPEEMVIELQRRWGLKKDQILDPPELKSPTQIEKFFEKNKKAELEELISHVSSGLTLVPEDDKRPHALSNPIDEFKKIENQ